MKQTQAANPSPTPTPVDPPRLKLRWTSAKCDEHNGGYSQDLLHELLDKYGHITALIVSQKKRGSAIVEFGQPEAAEKAFNQEAGLDSNPLKITWLSGRPDKITNTAQNGKGSPKNEDGNSASNDDVMFTGMSAPPAGGNFDDFENLVLRNLRQAQERKRLAQEMLESDEKD